MVKQGLALIVIIAMARMARNSGFTLLELVFVIMILGVLSMIALRGYGNIQQRSQTEAASMRIIEYLRLAYDKASASDKTATCDTYEGSYTVALVGSDMNLTPDGCPVVATYSFGDFDFPEGDFSTTFLPLGRGVTGNTCMVVKHPRSDVCSVVTVESTGVASEELAHGASCVCP